MTTSHESGSAKILQFPARGRFATGDRRDDAKPAATSLSLRLAKVAYGGAWYHDEAIREAEHTRGN